MFTTDIGGEMFVTTYTHQILSFNMQKYIVKIKLCFIGQRVFVKDPEIVKS